MLLVLLAFLGAWFSSNLFYTLFWTVLGKWGFPITEAQMVAYIAANLLPFLLILLVGAILSFVIRHQLATAGAANAAYVPIPTPTVNNPALRPELKCSFSMNDPGCVHRNITYTEQLVLAMPGQQPAHFPKQARCDWYRIRVSAENGSIPGCRGRLLSVKRGGNELLNGENPPLQFTHNEPDRDVAINEGVSEYLDLLGILYDQRVVLAVPLHRRSSSIQWNDMFSLAGDYEIRAAVTSPHTSAAPIDLILRWNLQPNSALIEQKSALLEKAYKGPFEITVGNDPSYYELAGRSLYTLNKLFKIKIENADREKTLTGCKVSILSIDPFCGYRSPWILRENFSLPAGDHTLIPLVKYEERREPEKYSEPAMHDTFQIQCQNEHKPLLGIESEHRLHIRCTANDAPYVDATIKLSVVGGRMQLEKL
ncbi:MAG: hypothetical protein WBW35_25870 [Xanthobacteraceae bacterium]